MEPSLNAPRMNYEQSPSLPAPMPEVVPGSVPEVYPDREPTRIEQEPQPAPQQPAPDPAVVPVLPQPVVQTDDTTVSPTVITDVPDTAADDDLIEKEWVNKAKHIIAQTVDDPRAREEAVGQLQREYLRKRYGKELGVSE
ncbi:MAG TPA: hypothetical protein PKD28_03025 [Candidatus Saccharibacteria bacterium]|nr:hypothetical protein [Candidatus Saccharibacteria bacterium]